MCVIYDFPFFSRSPQHHHHHHYYHGHHIIMVNDHYKKFFLSSLDVHCHYIMMMMIESKKWGIFFLIKNLERKLDIEIQWIIMDNDNSNK